MARYCNQCNRKFGFFEQGYDGICKDCYDKKIEEERKRKYEEQQKKIREEEEKRKIEEQRRLEKQKKLEEKQKEDEKKRLEEQKKIKEEREQEEKNKLKKFNMNFIQNDIAMQTYENIIKRDIKALGVEFEKKYESTSDILNYLIKSNILKLNSNYNLQDIIILYNKVENFNDFIIECAKYDKRYLYNIKINDKSKILKSSESLIKDFLKKQFDRETLNHYLSETSKFMSGNTIYDIEDFIYDINLSSADKFRFKQTRYEYGGADFDKTYTYDYYSEDKPMYVKLFSVYFYSMLVIYVTKLFEYVENFRREEEFYTMYTNLIKETNADYQYICSKLFPIYKACYKNISNEELTEIEFSTIIYIDAYNKVFNEICKECLKNSLVDFKENLLNSINSDENINNSIVKNLHNINIEEFNNEMQNVDNKKPLLIRIMIDILKDKVKIDDVFQILENMEKTMKNIEIEVSNYEATLERDRLLKGDFSKEIEMQKQAVEYSNVQNGYEFEEYVAKLYQKLGYTIEEVTKKSGDQRCRCYCIQR